MTSPRRVLVVDDQSKARAAYASELRAAGHEVTEIGSGTEALAFLQSKGADLVLCEIQLPDSDGLTLARQLRKRGRRIPVVLTSEAYVSASVRREITAEGVQFLAKPIAPSTLIRIVARALRGSVLFENQKGDEIELRSFNATDVKNRFGKVLEAALRDGATVVTRHDAPSAVLVSLQEFDALTDARRQRVIALSPDFDELLARMQTTGAKEATRGLFRASAAELGAAAVKGARKPR